MIQGQISTHANFNIRVFNAGGNLVQLQYMMQEPKAKDLHFLKMAWYVVDNPDDVLNVTLKAGKLLLSVYWSDSV